MDEIAAFGDVIATALHIAREGVPHEKKLGDFLGAVLSGRRPVVVPRPPKAEVFGGYSYLNFDTNYLTIPSRQSANGWEGTTSANVTNWFGVEFDGSGYYRTYPESLPPIGSFNLDASDYAFLAGPRFRYGPLFAHALIGADHLSVSTVVSGFTYSASQDSIAGGADAGFEWPVHSRIGFEVTGDYLFSRHDIAHAIAPTLFPSQSFAQNNFRVAVGIVFRFGSVHRKATATPATPTTLANQIHEAALLGVEGYATSDGFEVTAVANGSPAAEAGINTDNVILTIDGKSVYSAEDVEAAVAASKRSTVTIEYRTEQGFPIEKTVKIQGRC